MVAQTSGVNMDGESGNFMEAMVSDGKTVALATDVVSRYPSYTRWPIHHTSIL